MLTFQTIFLLLSIIALGRAGTVGQRTGFPLPGIQQFSQYGQGHGGYQQPHVGPYGGYQPPIGPYGGYPQQQQQPFGQYPGFQQPISQYGGYQPIAPGVPQIFG